MIHGKHRPGLFFGLLASGLAAASCRKTNDYWITGMQVIQAVQTSGDGVPLVAYKPTFVRVYVQSNEAKHGPWRVGARLVVKDLAAGTQEELTPATFGPGGSITAPPSGSHKDLWGDSFTFWLNYLETSPGDHLLSARIFSGPDVSNPPEEHTFSLQPYFYPAVRASVYGVVWAVTDTKDGGAPATGPAAPWSDYFAHKDYVENVFPVSGFTVNPIPGIGNSPPNPQPFGNLTTSRKWASSMEVLLPKGSKINLLDNWDTGGLHGLAWGSSSETQNPRDNRVGKTLAQEVSHTFGLWCHTFDPCDVYPHPQGHIDPLELGFNLSGDLGRSDVHLVSFSGERDVLDNQTIAGPVSDFMSYNLPPIWISAYTTCQEIGVLWDTSKQDVPCNSITTEESKPGGRVGDANKAKVPAVRGGDVGKAKVPTLPRATPTPPPERFGQDRAFLFAAGVVAADGGTRIADLEMIPSRVNISKPTTGDELKLQLLDAGGATLKEFPFGVHTTHLEPGRPAPFSLLVPFEDQKEKAVKVVVRRGDVILAEQAIPRAYPRIRIVPLPSTAEPLTGRHAVSWTGSDPDGHPLTYSVLYSADEGKTWWPVHVGLKQTRVEVDFDNLPGSEKALLKVRASNGGKSSEATLATTLRVPRKPPRVSIDRPAEGAILNAKLPQLLRGEAFGWEDGVLEDGSSFVWSSDREGELGRGHWTVTWKLAPGPHAITLTVHDSSGQTASVTAHVVVREASVAGEAPAK